MDPLGLKHIEALKTQLEKGLFTSSPKVKSNLFSEIYMYTVH